MTINHMSSLGHVLDMVRRDKENRELRGKFAKKNTIQNQRVLKSKKKVEDISLSKIENIRADVERKNRADDNAMSKSMLIMISACVIIVVISFFILSALGWL